MIMEAVPLQDDDDDDEQGTSDDDSSSSRAKMFGCNFGS